MFQLHPILPHIFSSLPIYILRDCREEIIAPHCEIGSVNRAPIVPLESPHILRKKGTAFRDQALPQCKSSSKIRLNQLRFNRTPLCLSYFQWYSHTHWDTERMVPRTQSLHSEFWAKIELNRLEFNCAQLYLTSFGLSTLTY